MNQLIEGIKKGDALNNIMRKKKPRLQMTFRLMSKIKKSRMDFCQWDTVDMVWNEPASRARVGR